MELKEMIWKRKSVRSYTDIPVEEEMLQKIKDFCAGMKPLYPDIKVRMEILDSDKVRCILPWKTPQVMAIFTEESKKALVNVGFLYQQADLYLQSLGLGSCWLGMGKPDPKAVSELDQGDGLKFAMILAFGNPKGEIAREDTAEFKRKSLEEIADEKDEKLEPARLAPSSVNSQPWYFVHDGEKIHAYCALSGVFKKTTSHMNLIDMGIALAHLYMCNPDTFRFKREKEHADLKQKCYIGTFSI